MRKLPEILDLEINDELQNNPVEFDQFVRTISDNQARDIIPNFAEKIFQVRFSAFINPVSLKSNI